jgi:hypothetical protein
LKKNSRKKNNNDNKNKGDKNVRFSRKGAVADRPTLPLEERDEKKHQDREGKGCVGAMRNVAYHTDTIWFLRRRDVFIPFPKGGEGNRDARTRGFLLSNFFTSYHKGY